MIYIMIGVCIVGWLLTYYYAYDKGFDNGYEECLYDISEYVEVEIIE